MTQTVNVHDAHDNPQRVVVKARLPDVPGDRPARTRPTAERLSSRIRHAIDTAACLLSTQRPRRRSSLCQGRRGSL